MSRCISRLRYTAFLIPGLVMMSVLQNAFANSSSSLIQSKVTGSLVFVLLPPISYLEFFLAYVIAAAIHGVAVGIGVLLVTVWFSPPCFEQPLWIFVFALLAAQSWGTRRHRRHLGRQVRPAGCLSELPDPPADHAFRRVLFNPFAAGVLAAGVIIQPVFYMIDGFRYGFFGVSDVSPLTTSLSVVAGAFLAGLRILARAPEARLQTQELNPMMPRTIRP